MEHLCVTVVSEGVYEEVSIPGISDYITFPQKPCLDYMRVNRYST